MDQVFNKKIIYEFIIILVSFWIPVTVFVNHGLYSIAILYFGLLAFIIATIKPLHLITLYVYFIPLSALIGTQNNFLGLLGFDEITQLGMLYFLSTYKTLKTRQLRIQVYAKKAILLIALYYIYYSSKGIYLGYDMGFDSHNFGYIFKLTIKLSLKYGPLLMLIQKLQIVEIRKYVLAAVLPVIITIVASMPFVDLLNNIGFVLKETSYSVGEVEGGAMRSQGFYEAGGDENSLAGFLLIAFGFLLGLYEKFGSNKKILLTFGIIIFGMFLTASRTAMISLGLILFLFLINNLKSNKKSVIKLIVFGVLFFMIASPIIIPAFQRFYAESLNEALDKNKYGRIGYYFIYGTYFIENPQSLIAGYTFDPIWYKRTPHNFFVLMLYNGGLIFPTLFAYYLYKLYKSSYKLLNSWSCLYMIIPYFLIICTINSEGSGIYLWILITANLFIQQHLNENIISNRQP